MAYKVEATDINTKSERIMNAVATYASYYRENPHRFVEEYLGLQLKPFQKIIINMFNDCDYSSFIACRGLGKTWLTGVFCCQRAILYPNTQICVASKTLKQAKELLSKIQNDLMNKSPNLCLEIKAVIMNSQELCVKFHNGSRIFAVVSNESARGARCNLLVVDEYRQVSLEIIQMVLKKFATTPRQTGYLRIEKYKHLAEKNKNIFMTSAWMKSHWSWDHVKSFAANMVDDTKKYFVCGLPYQLAISEGLLLREAVEDEMSEDTFSPTTWLMEMQAEFLGENENSFFKYEELLRVRKLTNAIYPQHVYSRLGKIIKYPKKVNGEIRVITADIAVMSSKKHKNDATAIFLLQLLPTKDGQYIRNVLYSKTFEGGHAQTQALEIRKLFEQMEADYIVIDTNGVGLGVYDILVTDIVDNETGIEYPGFTCMNDEEMADRYKGIERYPRKVIYSIKANAQFNSDCAFMLRDAIVRCKMKLLSTETQFHETYSARILSDYDEIDIADLKEPFVQTSLLINELVNLECITDGSKVKLKEQGSARKDRYSSLSYGNYFANELERKLRKPRSQQGFFEMPMRAPQLWKEDRY